MPKGLPRLAAWVRGSLCQELLLQAWVLVRESTKTASSFPCFSSSCRAIVSLSIVTILAATPFERSFPLKQTPDWSCTPAVFRDPCPCFRRRAPVPNGLSGLGAGPEAPDP